MRHPAFTSIPHLLFFMGTCLLVGLAITLSQWGLVSVSAGILILDGLVTGIGFGFLFVLLWYVTHFASLTGTDNLQKYINYTALIVLVNLVWLGIDYILMYLFTSDLNFERLTHSLPLKITLGVLLYTLSIQFLIGLTEKETKMEEQEEEGIEQKKPDSHRPGVEEAYANPAPAIGWLQKITVKVGQKIHVIAVTDILFLQAEGDYVKIYTASNHFIKEQTMKYFEENLESSKFIRIHRSTLVNVDAISRIELYEKQYYRVSLHSGHQLKASASGYRTLKNTLKL